VRILYTAVIAVNSRTLDNLRFLQCFRN
jgi:hypothetical protein